MSTPLADSNSATADLARRNFLVSSAAIATGFIISWKVADAGAASQIDRTPRPGTAALQSGALPLTDWVRVTKDDVVTIVVSQAEMGQGISTTLPAILCDELGADWSRVVFELAPTKEAYRNPRISWQFTGNSESIQSFAAHMRKVGATARLMLSAAAAERWQVPLGECYTQTGTVIHRPTQRGFKFGDLAESAAKQKLPPEVILRPDNELRLVGRSVPRVDVPSKVDGSAKFGIDYVPPGLTGLLHAAIRTVPAYGAKPVKVNRAEIKSRPGVIDVVELPNAIAVVAEKYWQARAALAAAEIEFDAGPHADLSSTTLKKIYLDKLENGPFIVAKDVTAEDAPAASSFVATYELPFQAHVTQEPMNAIAHVRDDGIDVWAPTQGQEQAKLTLAAVFKRAAETVQVHRAPFLGGGFGRRLLPDFCVDATMISKAVNRPVKVLWSREEDMRRDYFRPATLHRITAELDKSGMPIRLSQKLVSPTILKPVFPPLDLSKGLDPSALEGTLHTPYAIPNWKTEFHLLDIPVPTSVYRTTGYGPSLFGLETFIDELAHRAKVDPYLFRRKLLANNPRALKVLDEVAKKSGWQKKSLPKGQGRGIAFVMAFETLVAQVIEVTVSKNKVRVDRVVSVVDPGTVFDPKIAEAGIEGGIIFGLTSAAKDEITFEKGGPVQRNFHEYDILRMSETPIIETHFIQSGAEKIGGVGEVGPVATAPALVNAIFAATGKRLRTLPLKRSGFTLA
jgi:isoquinoline 1-oxidoreductase subunit beta